MHFKFSFILRQIIVLPSSWTLIVRQSRSFKIRHTCQELSFVCLFLAHLIILSSMNNTYGQIYQPFPFLFQHKQDLPTSKIKTRKNSNIKHWDIDLGKVPSTWRGGGGRMKQERGEEVWEGAWRSKVRCKKEHLYSHLVFPMIIS